MSKILIIGALFLFPTAVFAAPSINPTSGTDGIFTLIERSTYGGFLHPPNDPQTNVFSTYCAEDTNASCDISGSGVFGVWAWNIGGNGTFLYDFIDPNAEEATPTINTDPQTFFYAFLLFFLSMWFIVWYFRGKAI